jgi:hypothetical protein
MTEPAAPHRARVRTEQGDTNSGAKGFAVILGVMLGIIGALWLIATLVSPH